MDVHRVEEAIRIYFAKGLADSTQRTYRSGKERYLKFCNQLGSKPLPLNERTLCAFVSHLALEGLKHKSIKVYLSAIRHLQIAEGLPDPYQGTLPRLEYVLKGIKRTQAEEGKGSRERLPITMEIMRKLKQVWDKRAQQWDTRMIWAACCLCFFGFLRISEITAPSNSGFNPRDHLCVSDLAVDRKIRPSLLKVSIKKSKTDPFRKGVGLFLGRTDSDVCPVTAITSYLEMRGSSAGILFKFEDGCPLTRASFVEAVRAGLREAGLKQASYCSHSFRIGAATTAAKVGIEDSVIKTLGRWESVAYLQYVKLPRARLASYTQRLARDTG